MAKQLPTLRDLVRVAAIDIGTNSTRLLIAETDGVSVTREITRQATITRLGQGVSDTRTLQKDRVSNTLSVIRDYYKKAQNAKVDRVVAVATSAMREAQNADIFLEEAQKFLNFMPSIISGDKEASLGYAGALSDPRIREMGSAFLVIDIGGGSTEIVFGDNTGASTLKSFPLGSVRLFEAFFESDPPPSRDIGTLQLHVRRVLESVLDASFGNQVIPIAVGGTACTLAAVTLALETYDAEKVHLCQLTDDKVLELLDKFASLPLTQREKIAGIEPGRADVIIAGTALLSEIMDYFGLGHVTISERDLLDGMILAVK